MTFTYIFLAALLISVALRHWLAQRQIRYVASHRNAVPENFAPKIREGYGTDNLTKLIDKHLSNIKTNRNSSRVYEGKTGEVLFRITSEGRISLSKTMVKKIDINDFTEYLGKYLEEVV